MSEKDIYMEKMKAQLEQWKADAEQLKAKAAGMGADAQVELKKKVEALEGQIEDGKAKLAELSDATEDAWEAVKDGMESAWAALKTGFSDAAKRFKDDSNVS